MDLGLNEVCQVGGKILAERNQMIIPGIITQFFQIGQSCYLSHVYIII